MSHEGIRILPEQEARRIAQEESRLQREMGPQATIPARVLVNKTSGAGVEIEWKDGHRSAWSFPWLRNACPCATCHEERNAEGREPGEPRPPAPTLLRLYEPPARPRQVTPVGRYAIAFHWSDGHQSGIYSWDYLRRNCRCEACRRA